MKKTLWICLSGFCLFFFLFSTVYYFSYRNMELKKKLELSQQKINLLSAGSGEATKELEGEQESPEENALAAGNPEVLSVNSDMLYISQNYNETDGRLTETILPIPEDYMGLTREGLIERLKEEGGGKSLVSFSSSRLVIRTREAVNPDSYRFLLLLEEGYLKIYYSDRSDVYMETYLTEDELPDTELDVLKTGYYIKGVEELYDYLESITS
ncbi:MAG: hypothetical protein HFI63_01950 [Lachnospiraceae bacterium]|nr:hypothetical protein [Lachnospiraceae bacterium]